VCYHLGRIQVYYTCKNENCKKVSISFVYREEIKEIFQSFLFMCSDCLGFSLGHLQVRPLPVCLLFYLQNPSQKLVSRRCGLQMDISFDSLM
jgi:hypothetical protein